MKKLWAIVCVVGFTGFWTYALSVAAALFGDRLFSPLELLVCIAGLAVGLYARHRLLHMTPRMHGQRAQARERLERSYMESAHS